MLHAICRNPLTALLHFYITAYKCTCKPLSTANPTTLHDLCVRQFTMCSRDSTYGNWRPVTIKTSVRVVANLRRAADLQQQQELRLVAVRWPAKKRCRSKCAADLPKRTYDSERQRLAHLTIQCLVTISIPQDDLPLITSAHAHRFITALSMNKSRKASPLSCHLGQEATVRAPA